MNYLCQPDIGFTHTLYQALYGRYIVETAKEGIACPPHITSQVVANLWPAYEDLFDSAEEYVLVMLMEQWAELCSFEDKIFQQVCGSLTRLTLIL